eukprot:Hpha_TRINITY_DN26245_c0_g1::TRINITY_DN26245_c0_g1_i1::g.184593::m.184593
MSVACRCLCVPCPRCRAVSPQMMPVCRSSRGGRMGGYFRPNSTRNERFLRRVQEEGPSSWRPSQVAGGLRQRGALVGMEQVERLGGTTAECLRVTRVRSPVWRLAPMVRRWSLVARTVPAGSGRWRVDRSCDSFLSRRAVSAPSPSSGCTGSCRQRSRVHCLNLSRRCVDTRSRGMTTTTTLCLALGRLPLRRRGHARPPQGWLPVRRPPPWRRRGAGRRRHRLQLSCPGASAAGRSRLLPQQHRTRMTLSSTRRCRRQRASQRTHWCRGCTRCFSSSVPASESSSVDSAKGLELSLAAGQGRWEDNSSPATTPISHPYFPVH